MTQIADNSFEDPLTRVVDAFIVQSVPEGPDEITKLLLVSRLTEAELAAAAPSADALVLAPRSVRSRPRWAVRLAATASLAAAVSAGVYTTLPDGAPTEQTAQSDPPAVVVPRAEDVQLERLARLLEQHLRLDRDRVTDRRDILTVVKAAIQANPRLANSDSWRIAQEKLGSALERPELIGLGVGVLSTIPLTHASF